MSKFIKLHDSRDHNLEVFIRISDIELFAYAPLNKESGIRISSEEKVRRVKETGDEILALIDEAEGAQ